MMENEKEVIKALKDAASEADKIDQETEEKILTDDQIEAAVKDAADFVDSLKSEVADTNSKIINFPTVDTDMEKKDMNVVVDPATGEEKILGPADIKNALNFSNIIDSINDDDNYLDGEEADIEVTEEDVDKYIKSDNANQSELGMYMKDSDNNIPLEDIKALLGIVNRRDRGEKFSMYKALPQSIKDLINKYIGDNKATMQYDAITLNTIRNSVAEALIEEFIADIKLDTIKHDFAEDMEKIYSESAKEISEASLDYIAERNKAYREGANNIEDPEKRAKLLAILDQIDGARDLTTLKEYAKKCKIKAFELEKSSRVYSEFEQKYKNSNNNIYAINLAIQVLARNMESYGCTDRDINGFFIAFCKQVMNYKPEVATEHAYMYYVLYYCALLDGDKSDTFKNNVMEVINNLRERNNWQ